MEHVFALNDYFNIGFHITHKNEFCFIKNLQEPEYSRGTLLISNCNIIEIQIGENGAGLLTNACQRI